MAAPDLSPFEFPVPDARPNYREAIDPLDGRYRDPETVLYLSEEARVGCQAYVEAALAHTYADFGKCSREAALEIEAAAQVVTLKEAEDREKGREQFADNATGHDIVALTDAITERVSDEAKPWVHAAATSYDIISTANALQHKLAVHRLIMPRLLDLGDVIASKTEQFAAQAQVGRTHGQHGVPITFGFTMSRYLGRLGDLMGKLDATADNLQGKFSGAVGGYNASALINDDPRAFEKAFLDKLGLQVCDYATQIVPAENLVRLLTELTNISGVMAQIGEDMRNLQRTEIAEVGEYFDQANQKGSSAMPHKKNPINFEQAAGIHREMIGQLVNALQDLVSDHQRDLRDSVSMRFFGLMPAIVAHTAANITKTLRRLGVNEESLERNLYMTNGQIGSEALQAVLRDQGNPKAYAIAKRLVQVSVVTDRRFGEVVADDDETADLLDEISVKQRQAILDPEEHYQGITESEARRHVTKWDMNKIHHVNNVAPN